MKNKIKTCLVLAVISTITLLCLASCGNMQDDAKAVVDDVRDGVNGVRDGIMDGVGKVKNSIKGMIPGVERGDQTGKNGDPYTGDEKDLSDDSFMGDMNEGITDGVDGIADGITDGVNGITNGIVGDMNGTSGKNGANGMNGMTDGGYSFENSFGK